MTVSAVGQGLFAFVYFCNVDLGKGAGEEHKCSLAIGNGLMHQIGCEFRNSKSEMLLLMFVAGCPGATGM